MIQPPMMGPRIGPTMAPMPKIAIATPCCFGGNASSRMDWLTGTSPPPAIPCITRKKIRLGRLQAEPQRKELTVNRTMEPIW